MVTSDPCRRLLHALGAVFIFPYCRQWNRYSCGAEVLRMGVKAITGQSIPRHDAESVLRCRPNGTYMTTLQRIFRQYGVQAGRMFKPTRRRVADALRQGQYVVIDDDRTYSVSHVMILPGCLSAHLVWVADPMIGLPTIRTYHRVVKSATMAFAVVA